MISSRVRSSSASPLRLALATASMPTITSELLQRQPAMAVALTFSVAGGGPPVAPLTLTWFSPTCSIRTWRKSQATSGSR